MEPIIVRDGLRIGLRFVVCGEVKGRRNLSMEGIVEDGFDKLVMEGDIVFADSEEDKLIKFRFMEARSKEIAEVGKVLGSSIRPNAFLDLGFEDVQVDARVLRRGHLFLKCSSP